MVLMTPASTAQDIVVLRPRPERRLGRSRGLMSVRDHIEPASIVSNGYSSPRRRAAAAGSRREPGGDGPTRLVGSLLVRPTSSGASPNSARHLYLRVLRRTGAVRRRRSQDR